MKSQINVVTLGPSITEQGGMGSVAKLLLSSGTEEFTFTHISTWNSNLGRIGLLLHFLQSCFSLFVLLVRNKVDIAHLHISEGGSLVRKFILSVIVWLFQKPVVLHAHGCEFHDFYAGLPPLGKRWINFYLGHCDLLIALSESWRKFYIESCHLPSEKVIVIKNPVDLPDEIPQRSSNKSVKLLFMGKINQRKGVYDIVQALAELEVEVRSNITLILAGSGEIESVQQLANQLGVIGCLKFPGWVDAGMRDQLLGEADIFLLPSYNEGLPMALLEAMAWELPAITTPVGGIPEVITSRKNGILVAPGDIPALAAAIDDLVKQGDFRTQLGIQARASVLDLDINHYRKNVREVYKGILTQSRRTKEPNFG